MNQQKAEETKSSIKQTIAKSTQDFPLLGNCLYWSFSETVIPYTDFTAILKNLNISEKLAPKTRTKTAVLKAIDEFIALQDASGTTKFRRKAVDDDKIAVYVIVHSHMDGINQDVKFETETKIKFDKKSNKITVTSAPGVEEQILALVAKYEDSYTSDQIRATVLRYVFETCLGVMVRDNGGLYFVPETKRTEYLNLRSLVETLSLTKGVKCSVDVIPVIDLPESRSSLWKAIIGEATSEMAEMRKDLEEIKGTPSASAQKLRLKRYVDLKTKIQMYEMLFQSTASDLVSELSRIEAIFQGKLEA